MEGVRSVCVRVCWGGGWQTSGGTVQREHQNYSFSALWLPRENVVFSILRYLIFKGQTLWKYFFFKCNLQTLNDGRQLKSNSNIVQARSNALCGLLLHISCSGSYRHQLLAGVWKKYCQGQRGFLWSERRNWIIWTRKNWETAGTGEP